MTASNSTALLIAARLACATLALLASGMDAQLRADPPAGRPILLAHRGIAPRYDMTGVTSDTCTATRMLPATDRAVFIENTLPSMAASFAAGADVVELDIHPTTDGEFAVFHDWTLECRTQGRGVTREHAMSELRQLDVGYGYTSDGGVTFPFRGQGIGLMPTLREVLERFPDGRFLINIKSNAPGEGGLLAAYLKALPEDPGRRLFVFGGERPVAALKAAMPSIKATSARSALDCLKALAGAAQGTQVPPPCRDSVVYVPVNMMDRMPGWPHTFLARSRAAGSEVFIIGPYDGGGHASGVDTLEMLRQIPPDWTGGIMTNELERVADALGRR